MRAGLNYRARCADDESMLVRLFALLVVLGLAAPAAAHGSSWPIAYTSVAKNPADALADLPIEESEYDPATRCSKKPKPGMTALIDWLGDNAKGVFWGTYRCEKWGRSRPLCTPRAAPSTGTSTWTRPPTAGRPRG